MLMQHFTAAAEFSCSKRLCQTPSEGPQCKSETINEVGSKKKKKTDFPLIVFLLFNVIVLPLWIVNTSLKASLWWSCCSRQPVWDVTTLSTFTQVLCLSTTLVTFNAKSNLTNKL